MRIEDLRKEKNGEMTRIAAKVVWENCDRAAQELYFETHEDFAEDLTCNPDAFLLATAAPAMHYGEKRVKINEEVCPELKNGLITAMSYISHWYLDNRSLPKIETKSRTSRQENLRPRRAGFFFSGGIDSFATLRANRLNYPPDHPLYIKDGIIVFGLEMSSLEAFGHVHKKYSQIASDLGINLIPLYTNLYLPYREEDEANHFDFWEHEFIGTALSSVAHAFAGRFSTVSISSTFCINVPVRYGSHPLIDPNLSSTDLRIRHEGYSMTRLSKARSIADWDIVQKHLRVCNHFKRYEENVLNCCKCEKCVRTMLEFMTLGVLEKSDAFSVKEIPAKLIREKVKITGYYIELSYQELLEPLSRIGRHDLVDVIKKKLALFRKGDGNWAVKVRNYCSSKILKGSVARIRKQIAGNVLCKSGVGSK